MAVPQTILDLIDKFNRHRAEYLFSDYKEYRVRADFIDPLFEALGWDMRNAQGRSEAERDVIHEPAIKMRSSRELAPLPLFSLPDE